MPPAKKNSINYPVEHINKEKKHMKNLLISKNHHYVIRKLFHSTA